VKGMSSSGVMSTRPVSASGGKGQESSSCGSTLGKWGIGGRLALLLINELKAYSCGCRKA
jgi:hypothetical protein